MSYTDTIWYDLSANLNLSFHAGADILNLLFSYGFLIFFPGIAYAKTWLQN